MKALSLACAVLSLAVCTAVARADLVALGLAHPRAELLAWELSRELAGFGHELVLLPAQGDGARAAALDHAARVLVWIPEGGPMRLRAEHLAVRAQREDAPLPDDLDHVAPQVFASLAASATLRALRASPEGGPLPLRRRDEPGFPPQPERHVPVALQPDDEPRSARSPSRSASAPRFFVRLAGGVGLFHANGGELPAALTEARLAAASDTADGDLDAVAQRLRSAGYRCELESQGDGRVVASACTRRDALRTLGAGELTIGVRVNARVALSLDARLGPAGARGIYGLSGELALLGIASRGPWLAARTGVGFTVAGAGSNLRVGPFFGPRADVALHGGALGGYRFSEHVGLFAAASLRLFMPEPSLLADLTAGLEVQL
jgi:hypothetical protein